MTAAFNLNNLYKECKENPIKKHKKEEKVTENEAKEKAEWCFPALEDIIYLYNILEYLHVNSILLVYKVAII